MATPATHIRRLFTPWRWWTPDNQHPFDRRHRVDTGGLLYADRLATGHAHDGHNAGYYATAPSLFHGAIDLWRQTLPATGCTVSDYTLVDIGCGKGRVLMLAVEYPFPEIVGVELNPHLARVARKNLRKWQRRSQQIGVPHVPGFGTWDSDHRVQILEADALSIPLPAGPVALFYFNSFERPMMEMWLSRLAELSRRRTAPLDLIYIHPEFERLVHQVSGVRVVVEAEIRFSDEDAGADAFGVSSDQCSVYRWNGS